MSFKAHFLQDPADAELTPLEASSLMSETVLRSNDGGVIGLQLDFELPFARVDLWK